MRTTQTTDLPLTAEEVAARFRVTKQAVFGWYHEGIIPAAVATGKIYRFDLAEVEAALAAHAAKRQAQRDEAAGMVETI